MMYLSKMYITKVDDHDRFVVNIQNKNGEIDKKVFSSVDDAIKYTNTLNYDIDSGVPCMDIASWGLWGIQTDCTEFRLNRVVINGVHKAYEEGKIDSDEVTLMDYITNAFMLNPCFDRSKIIINQILLTYAIEESRAINGSREIDIIKFLKVKDLDTFDSRNRMLGKLDNIVIDNRSKHRLRMYSEIDDGDNCILYFVSDLDMQIGDRYDSNKHFAYYDSFESLYIPTLRCNPCFSNLTLKLLDLRCVSTHGNTQFAEMFSYCAIDKLLGTFDLDKIIINDPTCRTNRVGLYSCCSIPINSLPYINNIVDHSNTISALDLLYKCDIDVHRGLGKVELDLSTYKNVGETRLLQMRMNTLEINTDMIISLKNVNMSKLNYIDCYFGNISDNINITSQKEKVQRKKVVVENAKFSKLITINTGSKATFYYDRDTNYVEHLDTFEFINSSIKLSDFILLTPLNSNKIKLDGMESAVLSEKVHSFEYISLKDSEITLDLRRNTEYLNSILYLTFLNRIPCTIDVRGTKLNILTGRGPVRYTKTNSNSEITLIYNERTSKSVFEFLKNSANIKLVYED